MDSSSSGGNNAGGSGGTVTPTNQSQPPPQGVGTPSSGSGSGSGVKVAATPGAAGRNNGNNGNIGAGNNGGEADGQRGPGSSSSIVAPRPLPAYPAAVNPGTPGSSASTTTGPAPSAPTAATFQPPPRVRSTPADPKEGGVFVPVKPGGLPVSSTQAPVGNVSPNKALPTAAPSSSSAASAFKPPAAIQPNPATGAFNTPASPTAVANPTSSSSGGTPSNSRSNSNGGAAILTPNAAPGTPNSRPLPHTNSGNNLGQRTPPLAGHNRGSFSGTSSATMSRSNSGSGEQLNPAQAAAAMQQGAGNFRGNTPGLANQQRGSSGGGMANPSALLPTQQGGAPPTGPAAAAAAAAARGAPPNMQAPLNMAQANQMLAMQNPANPGAARPSPFLAAIPPNAGAPTISPGLGGLPPTAVPPLNPLSLNLGGASLLQPNPGAPMPSLLPPTTALDANGRLINTATGMPVPTPEQLQAVLRAAPGMGNADPLGLLRNVPPQQQTQVLLHALFMQNQQQQQQQQTQQQLFARLGQPGVQPRPGAPGMPGPMPTPQQLALLQAQFAQQPQFQQLAAAAAAAGRGAPIMPGFPMGGFGPRPGAPNFAGPVVPGVMPGVGAAANTFPSPGAMGFQPMPQAGRGAPLNMPSAAQAPNPYNVKPFQASPYPMPLNAPPAAAAGTPASGPAPGTLLSGQAPPSAAAPPPAKVEPPPAREKKALLITDSSGNPIDLSDLPPPPKRSGPPPVTQPIQASAASAGAATSTSGGSLSASPSLSASATPYSAKPTPLDLSGTDFSTTPLPKQPLPIITPPSVKSDASNPIQEALNNAAAAAVSASASTSAATSEATAESVSAPTSSQDVAPVAAAEPQDAAATAGASGATGALAAPGSSLTSSSSSSSLSSSVPSTSASPSPSNIVPPGGLSVPNSVAASAPRSPAPAFPPGIFQPTPPASSSPTPALEAQVHRTSDVPAPAPAPASSAGPTAATVTATAPAVTSDKPAPTVEVEEKRAEAEVAKPRGPILPLSGGVSTQPYRVAAKRVGTAPPAERQTKDNTASATGSASSAAAASSDTLQAPSPATPAPAPAPTPKGDGSRMVNGRKTYDKDFLLSFADYRERPFNFPMVIQPEIEVKPGFAPFSMRGAPAGSPHGAHAAASTTPKPVDNKWARPQVPSPSTQDVRNRATGGAMQPQGRSFQQGQQAAVRADQQRQQGGPTPRNVRGPDSTRNNQSRVGGRLMAPGRGQQQNYMSDIPVQPLAKSNTRWLPGLGEETELDRIRKKVQGLLNKLAVDKFDTITHQLTDLIVENKNEGMQLLKLVVGIIFDKALSEQFFSSMYADLCAEVSKVVAPINEFEGEAAASAVLQAEQQKANLSEEEKAKLLEKQAKMAKKSPFRHILLTKCFPESDTRVLTQRGFMFLEQIEAYNQAVSEGDAEPLMFACYDAASASLCYCPGEIVYSAPPKRWVHFTTPQTESLWNQRSDDYGSVSFAQDANHISLRVTPEHSMYVQPTGDSEIPFQAIPAVELTQGYACSCPVGAACAHNCPSLRFHAAAQAGVAPSNMMQFSPEEPADSPVQRLSLQSEEQLDAFLEFYGYWLGHGSLSYSNPCAIRVNALQDAQYLHQLLSKTGVAQWTYDAATLCFSIFDAAWFQYFDSEYHSLETESSKWCWSWALTRLSARQIQLVLEGYRAAGCTQEKLASDGEKQLSTSSILLRDSLVQACLHAGYSVRFQRAADSSWSVFYSCDRRPVLRSKGIRYDNDAACIYDPVRDGRVWCINVKHPDHLIIAQRAYRSKHGVVTKASRPVVVGNCQQEFEAGIKEITTTDLSEEQIQEKKSAQKRRFLGNIKFIGELYKKGMLIEKIMHTCIAHLIGDINNPSEEDLEAVCNLLITIGKLIDHEKAAPHVNSYFDRFKQFSQNMKLSSRTRFMCLDLIDMRKSGWSGRRKPQEVKSLDAVRKEAQEEAARKAAGNSRIGGSAFSRPGTSALGRPILAIQRPGAAGTQDVRAGLAGKKATDRYAVIPKVAAPTPTTPAAAAGPPTPTVTISASMLASKMAGQTPTAVTPATAATGASASSLPAFPASSSAASSSASSTLPTSSSNPSLSSIRKSSGATSSPAPTHSPVDDARAASNIRSTIREYLANPDLNEVRTVLSELQPSQLPLVVSESVSEGLQNPKTIQGVAALCKELFIENLLQPQDFADGIIAALAVVDPDFISDEMPKAPEFIGSMLATFCYCRCVDLNIIERAASQLVESGEAIQIFAHAAKFLLEQATESLSTARSMIEAGGIDILALMGQESLNQSYEERARLFKSRPYLLQLYPTAPYDLALKTSVEQVAQALLANPNASAQPFIQMVQQHQDDHNQVNFLRSIVELILRVVTPLTTLASAHAAMEDNQAPNATAEQIQQETTLLHALFGALQQAVPNPPALSAEGIIFTISSYTSVLRNPPNFLSRVFHQLLQVGLATPETFQNVQSEKQKCGIDMPMQAEEAITACAK